MTETLQKTLDRMVERGELTTARDLHGKTHYFVAGSPFNRMGEKKRRFFFDQQGKLTSHFGIARVPAVVEPAGQVLKISEIEMSGAGA